MAKDGRPHWGQRFREMAKDNGHSLASLAEKLERAESTLRSWTNGTREINLSEFFELCAAAGVNPSRVLFGDVSVDAEIKRQADDLAAHLISRKLPKALRSKAKA